MSPGSRTSAGRRSAPRPRGRSDGSIGSWVKPRFSSPEAYSFSGRPSRTSGRGSCRPSSSRSCARSRARDAGSSPRFESVLERLERSTWNVPRFGFTCALVASIIRPAHGSNHRDREPEGRRRERPRPRSISPRPWRPTTRKSCSSTSIRRPTRRRVWASRKREEADGLLGPALGRGGPGGARDAPFPTCGYCLPAATSSAPRSSSSITPTGRRGSGSRSAPFGAATTSS